MSKSPSAQDIINLLDASPYEMKVKDMADVFKLKVSSKAYDQMRRTLHRTITGVTATPTGVSLAQLQDQADKYQAVIECLKDSLRNEKCKLQVILDLIRQGGGTAPTQAGLFDG